jgi:hypothetical protein
MVLSELRMEALEIAPTAADGPTRPDPSLPSAPAFQRRNASSNMSFYFQAQRLRGAAKRVSREGDAMRNALRIVIVLSAIMGLLVVQRFGSQAGVLSSASRH